MATESVSPDHQDVRLFRSNGEGDDGGFMPGTPEERLAQVWELTREAWFFAQGVDSDQPLRRDVAVFVRRGG